MIMFRLVAVLAIASVTEPALAASLDLVSAQPTAGVSGAAYFRIPLSAKQAHAPYVGLKMAMMRQDRDVAGLAFGPRREADAVDIRVSLKGEPSLALAGTPVTGVGALAATEDGRKHSPWRTVAFVTGGLVLAGAAYYAYLIHEAEKNSD